MKLSRARSIKLVRRRRKNNRKHGSYRFITKTQLIKKYEELKEDGKNWLDQYEDLRIEYISLLDKYTRIQENNRELVARNAASLHEIETLRQQISNLNRDFLIKISGARRKYALYVKSKLDEIKTLKKNMERFECSFQNCDPFVLMEQEYEKSLSMDDINHLHSLVTPATERRNRLFDEKRNQERIKEKLAKEFCERIDLTAIEEQSPILCVRNDGTFSLNSREETDSHIDEIVERPTNSTMIDTLSFRHIVPITPQLNQTDNGTSTSPDESNWEYNSANYKSSPFENLASTSLDSIQNFVPKTPKLTQPLPTIPNCDPEALENPLKSHLNRLSVAYPEKTPVQSPVTSISFRSRSSRRLLKESLPKSVDQSQSVDFTVNYTKSDSIDNDTAKRRSRDNETQEDVQSDSKDSSKKRGSRDNETQENAQSDANSIDGNGMRRSRRKKRRVNYREK